MQELRESQKRIWITTKSILSCMPQLVYNIPHTHTYMHMRTHTDTHSRGLGSAVLTGNELNSSLRIFKADLATIAPAPFNFYFDSQIKICALQYFIDHVNIVLVELEIHFMVWAFIREIYMQSAYQHSIFSTRQKSIV